MASSLSQLSSGRGEMNRNSVAMIAVSFRISVSTCRSDILLGCPEISRAVCVEGWEEFPATMQQRPSLEHFQN